MKKKLAIMVTGVCMLTLLTGCSSGTYSKYVKLGDYKDLEVSMIKSEVSDEMVEEELTYLLEDYTEYTDITDRGVQEGDSVNIDFVGKIDGEEFEDGSADDFDLIIGEGYFLDDLEVGIIDMETNETKEISLVFPEDYDEDLSGATAVFTVTVNAIQKVTIPELTDEFVAGISEFSTVDEYKKDFKDSLLASQNADNYYTAGSEALAIAISNATITGYPEDLYETSKIYFNEMNASFAEMFGMEVSDLAGSEEEQKEAILEMVNEEMVMVAIAEKEKIKVSEEEYNQYLEENYEDFGYTSIAELESDYSKDELISEILKTKVQDFLLEHAKITETDEDDYYDEDDDDDFDDDDDDDFDIDIDDGFDIDIDDEDDVPDSDDDNSKNE